MKNHGTFIILAALCLSLYFLINFNKIISFIVPENSGVESISLKFPGDIRLTPPVSPVPTSIPTLIPTPTSAPLVGYCLNVPVLMYHHIQPNAKAQENGQQTLSVDNGEFDLQMGYLVSQGYSIISAQQLTDALINHSALLPKSVVVTMDDGYKDIYTYAFPILQKYHIRANLAVISGLVGGTDYVSWEEIKEMSDSGLVQMLNHTWSHHAIAYGSEDKAKYEIKTASQQLQDYTGQNINVFVYPFGVFNKDAISILQASGIKSAFSEIPGHWQCDSFVMALRRTRIGNAPLSYYGL